MNRRKFLKLIMGFLALLSGKYIFSSTALGRRLQESIAILKDGCKPKFLRQIITKDNTSTRTIMWQTNTKINGLQVEFRKAEASSSESISAKEASVKEDGQCFVIYSATCKNLQPNASYQYRVTGEGVTDEWHKMHTDNGTHFKALIFPDSQCADYDVWEELAKNAWKRNGDTDFFINMGDLIDNGEDQSQWHAWLNGAEDFLDKIPLAPMMGNHEMYGKEWKICLPNAYLAEFDVPANESPHFEKYYYSFDYGPVHFTVLNTQWEEMKDFEQGLLEEQLAWIEKDLASSQKKWHIVLAHRDVLQYRTQKHPDRQEGFSEFGKKFMPIFDKFHTDLVLTAHLHTYRNHGHIKNFEDSTDGPYYVLTGVAGDVRYPNLWLPHALDKKTAPQPETDNYLTLEADEMHLLLKCFLPDGSCIDTIELKK